MQKGGEARAVRSEDMGGDEVVIYVDAFPITGKHIAVRTTHGEVMDAVQTFRDLGADRAQDTYRSAYRAVMDVDGMALATLAEADGADAEAVGRWVDYCNDVVICHAARAVLFNKPIPTFSLRGAGGASPPADPEQKLDQNASVPPSGG